MNIEDLVGTFTIMGSNQDDSENVYRGILELSINDNRRIDAKWLIQDEQEQFGTGFFKDNILMINFYYLAENTKYKGVVVYRVLTKDILDGFWSEKHGNPLYLGEERCFRVKEEINILN